MTKSQHLPVGTIGVKKDLDAAAIAAFCITHTRRAAAEAFGCALATISYHVDDQRRRQRSQVFRATHFGNAIRREIPPAIIEGFLSAGLTIEEIGKKIELFRQAWIIKASLGARAHANGSSPDFASGPGSDGVGPGANGVAGPVGA